jgi:ribosome-binding factor A
MARKKSSSATPGQRQLRVGEELRHALAHILGREADRLSDPDLHGKSVTVTEIRMSPDLRNATVFVVPLGATVDRNAESDAQLIKALNRAGGFFRGLLAREVKMQFSPSLRFRLDESFEQATRIESLLHDPAVARDLAPTENKPAGPESGGDKGGD